MQKLLEQCSVWSLRQAYTTVFNEVRSHPEVVQRLERAYILLSRDMEYSIERVGSKDLLQFSISSPNGGYTVVPSQQRCTCPDAQQGQYCKHRLAIRLLLLALKGSHQTKMARELEQSR